jgi:hypothetical protein
MSWNLVDLEPDTRHLMLEEFDTDVEAGLVYKSAVIEVSRMPDYIAAQRQAYADGDPGTLATAILNSGMLRSHQSNGAAVNAIAAASRVAGGQFGVYYARGVAAKALLTGRDIVIYRARSSSSPRPESEALVGRRLDATRLLGDLRVHASDPGAFSVLPQVNSGLSVRLGTLECSSRAGVSNPKPGLLVPY